MQVQLIWKPKILQVFFHQMNKLQQMDLNYKKINFGLQLALWL
jgi:hypothetical protein